MIWGSQHNLGLVTTYRNIPRGPVLLTAASTLRFIIPAHGPMVVLMPFRSAGSIYLTQGVLRLRGKSVDKAIEWPDGG